MQPPSCGAIEPSGLTLVLEPGRWIVGPAGVLLTAVVDMKSQADAATFVVVDAGMTDLLRPALYGAWHEIQAAEPRAGAPMRADIVGPVCETSDTLGRDRTLPPTEVGDLLVIRDMGAYGIGDGIELQPAPLGRRSADRRRRLACDSEAPDNRGPAAVGRIDADCV